MGGSPQGDLDADGGGDGDARGRFASAFWCKAYRRRFYPWERARFERQRAPTTASNANAPPNHEAGSGTPAPVENPRSEVSEAPVGMVKLITPVCIKSSDAAALIVISEISVGVIERAAASAMLHSFYTEIEKILKLIAREWDDQMPASET